MFRASLIKIVMFKNIIRQTLDINLNNFNKSFSEFNFLKTIFNYNLKQST